MSTCSTVFSNADVEFYVAPQAEMPADNLEASWEGVTGWLEVKGLSSIGARGPKRPTVQFKPLKGNMCVSPGLTDFGTMTFTAADLPEDPGQREIIDEALISKLSWPCKIVHKDETTALDVPTTEYFAGPILSFSQDPISDPDSNRTRSGEVAINQYLEVARHSST